jgi:hypothetical protein
MDNPYQPPAEPPRHLEPIEMPDDGGRRPTVLTVFGIINITWASTALLCCTPFVILGFFVATPPGQESNPVLQLTKDPGYRLSQLILSVPSIIASCVLLASGIGLLLVRPWSRTLGLGYACYKMVESLINAAVNYIYIVHPMLLAAQGNADPSTIGAVVGSLFGVGFGFLYPIILAFAMTRPEVVRALRPRQSNDVPSTWEPL